ncbi:sulfatase-like hydrolase/transferase [Neolewinella aurantiaca]|uniref:Sulfatase-like hydrolase/transferase n=1 Tax=Neolewinella aurantiaca TaxID=2602767 RepID=A0A5C7F0L7_9BACT|nr:sulfatase-like hydrolase/transferase [Neolewinella aurantiaca]TXF82799.1 sulfatase-like hydrolase/transferase [Neolewinella aurantiaca]
MQKQLLTAFLVVTTSVLYPQSPAPNILVVLTDDMGYADLSVHNQEADVRTPNIDRLARSGALCTAGYITAPQCIPSRAGLLSGRYQQRYGLDHNGTIPLPLTEKLIPERLKDAGYATGMAGKWHLEPNHQQEEWIREHLPELAEKKTFVPSDIPDKMKRAYRSDRRGFDDVFEGYINNYLTNYTLAGEDKETSAENIPDYRLDIQTEAALSFIRRHKEEPFFYYLSYFAPHVPLEAPSKYLDRFPGEMPERRRHCLAMLSAVDDGVGRVQDLLAELGLTENTLVFFISDNGAPLKMIKEDITLDFKGGAWDGSLNTPFIGEKGMLSEGGIHVPFVVSWSGTIPAGQRYDHPVSSLDVAATSLAAAGLPTAKELDGKNLLPHLNGTTTSAPHKYLFWRFWEQIAVRSGNYKYLRVGGREFLFDVTTDEHETNNLLGEHPRKARKLARKLDRWTQSLKNPGVPGNPNQSETQWYDFYFPKTED